jgi:hypothetical protein
MLLHADFPSHPQTGTVFRIALKNAVHESLGLQEVAKLAPTLGQDQQHVLIFRNGIEKMLELRLVSLEFLSSFREQDFPRDLSGGISQVRCPLTTNQGSFIVALKS